MPKSTTQSPRLAAPRAGGRGKVRGVHITAPRDATSVYCIVKAQMPRSLLGGEIAATTFVFACAALVGCGGSPADGGPPVIALLTIDTWRWDHFSEVHTPRLWALAQEGTRFDAAYAPIGLTSPSHATMLTGLMPWEHGMEANNHHGYALSTTIPRVMSNPSWDDTPKGAFVSAYPAGPEGGLGVGFDVFDGPESGERAGAETVRRALAWLPDDEAAFLWVHVYEPHGPYEGRGSTDVERYAEEVRLADTVLTPLVDTLVARGSTIVVAADHGEVLLEERCGRQHERSTSSHVMHVPLFRWTPDRPRAVHTQMTGLEAVPDLLRGKLPEFTAVRYAEAGICEPGCTPGCQPDGVRGRERVVWNAEGGRATLRGGTIRTTGAVTAEQVNGLKALPPVPAPGEPNVHSLEQLGYSEP